MELAVQTVTHSHQKSDSKPQTDNSLEAIAVRLRSGDAKALEALVSRTEKACYHLAYSLLQDAELSKDAVQEAYLIVYQRASQLNDPKALKKWLFRIVTHCSHNIRRKRKKEFGGDVEDKEESSRPPVGMRPDPDPASQVVSQQRLKQVFEQLPEIDRTSLALREVCSMTYEEMSQVLKVPIGTVRSRLAKARKRFVAIYKGKKS